MKFSCRPRNKANMRCCRNITRCRGLAQARSTMRLENEPTEFGKIKTRQLLPAMPLFANGSTSRCCQRGTLEQKSRKLLDIGKGSI